ncbi:13537_t:CDS:1, partial [Funneliformis mosseae]
SIVRPAFGSEFDLVIRGNSMNCYSSNTYSKVHNILDDKQTIADYEVFRMKQQEF